MTTPTMLVVLTGVSSTVFFVWRLHRFLRRVERVLDAAALATTAGATTLARVDASLGELVPPARAALERIEALTSTALERIEALTSTALERIEALTSTADASFKAVVPEVRAALLEVKSAGEVLNDARILLGNMNELVLDDARPLLGNVNELVETLELKRVPGPFRRLCCLGDGDRRVKLRIET
jgi:hypothetical protein